MNEQKMNEREREREKLKQHTESANIYVSYY